jgi:hypothetical protein
MGFNSGLKGLSDLELRAIYRNSKKVKQSQYRPGQSQRVPGG